LQARPRAGLPRGALVALAALLSVGVVFIVRRERGAAMTAPAVDAVMVAERSADTFPGAPSVTIPDLPDTPSAPITRAAIRELAASADLRGAVSSESAGTPNGRLASTILLQQAEESAIHVHDLIAKSIAVARAAASSASLDPRERQQVLEDVQVVTDRTLMLGGKLRETRLQAISTARRMIVFMEEKAGSYEVSDGEVRFTRASDQVQFSHFQVSASRALSQEQLVRRETADALAEQEQLLARAGIR
jgi:hypothetical protein